MLKVRQYYRLWSLIKGLILIQLHDGPVDAGLRGGGGGGGRKDEKKKEKEKKTNKLNPLCFFFSFFSLGFSFSFFGAHKPAENAE